MVSKILSSKDITKNHKDVNAKSFGYVIGMNNNSFTAIKVFKTKVTRSQRNGKDNAKILHCVHGLLVEDL